MTRDDAAKIVAHGMQEGSSAAYILLSVFEKLGMVKFDDAATKDNFPFTQTGFCKTCGNMVSIEQPTFPPLFEIATIRGTLPGKLAEAISNEMVVAKASGMEFESICGIVIGVAADYWRLKYGDDSLDQLATLITAQRGRPLPPIG